MPSFNVDNYKFKLLSFDELVINLDRLSRFKPPEDSYNRVFYSILSKCLISPNYSKSQLEELPVSIISSLVKLIWNKSVMNLFPSYENNFQVNKALKYLSTLPFKNIDSNTKVLLNTKLFISPVLEHISYDTAPLNLKFLIKVNSSYNFDKTFYKNDIDSFRRKYSLKFPIKKVLIVEGITEENLIPVFANKLGFNFDKEGIFVLGAGGKSKSPDLYLKLKDKLNIPIILLFDSDAKSICLSLNNLILKKDKIILIKNGEFEDILSLNLIKRALNSEYETCLPIIKDDLHIFNKMCDNLEYFYRTRNIGEFKKSKFSKIIAKNIKYLTDFTNDVKEIIYALIDKKKGDFL